MALNRVENIEPNPKPQDDIPALLPDLQHPRSPAPSRSICFPASTARVCRPGMEIVRILVMGVAMLGAGLAISTAFTNR